MILSMDLETWAMSAQSGPTPAPVCLAITAVHEDKREDALFHFRDDGFYMAGHYSTSPKPVRERLIGAMKNADMIVGQNICFDLGVLLGHCEQETTMLQTIVDSLDQGRIYDTLIAEKMLDLAEFGVIKEGFVNGMPVKLDYTLDKLAERYGVLPEGYGEMKHAGDAWRIRYGELWDISLSKWPEAAIKYPMMDTSVTLAVADAQQRRRAKISEAIGHDPLASLALRMKAAFALRMTGAFGVIVDREVREQVRAEAEKTAADAYAPLVAAGIVTPAVPAMPYKPRGKEGKPVLNPDGSLKMKKPEDEKLNKKALVQHILSLVENDMLDVADIVLSDKALDDKEFAKAFEKDALAALIESPEYVSTAAEFMNEHAGKGPKDIEIEGRMMTLLEVFKLRQSVQKTLTTELPRISPDLPGDDGVILSPDWNCVAWPEYDAMKETGRSSSYASKLFPSLNAQNIAKGMRKAFRSRGNDRLILSADFASMELVTAAQTCLVLFGKSVLAEVLNSGLDAHGYLGAQIAYAKWAGFRMLCDSQKAETVRARYDLFAKLKKSDDKMIHWEEDKPEVAAKVGFKHFRTLAKPTGLGLWGGLGAETFVTYAKTTYGVHITLDEAKELIAIWKATFPEAETYFAELEKDEKHSFSRRVEKRKSVVTVNPITGKKVRTIETESKVVEFNKYRYITPNGLIRSNCDYCAAANGKALQSPSAEGALAALYEVVVECLFDRFFGALPYAFVHDEILLDVPHDKTSVAEAYKKLDEIMVRNFSIYAAPDVGIKTEPGLMMHWSKEAGPDYDEEGHLLTIEEVKAGIKKSTRPIAS